MIYILTIFIFLLSTVNIQAQECFEYPPGSGYLYTTDYLNVHTEPYYQGEIIGMLSPNSKIIRVSQGESEYWDVIIIDGQNYYVHTDYLDYFPLDTEEIIEVDSLEDLYLEFLLKRDEYLGEFTLTAYCSCSKCCGNWGEYTSSGTIPEEGRTVACNVLPAGTKIIINEKIYIVEDTGLLGKNKIDIYMDSHEDALEFGVKEKVKVYLAEDRGE